MSNIPKLTLGTSCRLQIKKRLTPHNKYAKKLQRY